MHDAACLCIRSASGMCRFTSRSSTRRWPGILAAFEGLDRLAHPVQLLPRSHDMPSCPSIHISLPGIRAVVSLVSSSTRSIGGSRRIRRSPFVSYRAHAGRHRPFSSQISPRSRHLAHIVVSAAQGSSPRSFPTTRNSAAQPGRT